MAQEWVNPRESYVDAYKKYEQAECLVPEDGVRYFRHFSRDREQLQGHPLLSHPQFAGAQIVYSWAELEPTAGEYGFSIVCEDFDYLRKNGKRLFVQLQDATFSPQHNPAPRYLRSEEYDGGAIYQRTEERDVEGWVAKRWNARARERFALFWRLSEKSLTGSWKA